MNIIIPIKDFNLNNVYYSEKIKNTVMPDSYFIRIIYSNSDVTLNGIYLKCFFSVLNISNHYNKYICNLNINENTELVSYLRNLEMSILQKFNIKEKFPVYNLQDSLSQNVIKIFSDLPILDTSYFILKISGIWESNREYGLTFKFIEH